MKASPLPDNEQQRLGAVATYHILDTADEQDFNDIVGLASQICETSMAIITFLDSNRQWFKAQIGLNVKETSRDISFCSYTINGDDLMYVNDALHDERFYDNPLVTGYPHIRFYAGFPLKTEDGYKIGSIAVLHSTPKDLSTQQLNSLRILGRQVGKLLALRLNLFELKQSNASNTHLASLLTNTNEAIISTDSKGIVMSWNKGAEKMYGIPSKEAIGKLNRTIFQSDLTTEEIDKIREILLKGTTYKSERSMMLNNGSMFYGEYLVDAVKNDDGQLTGYVILVRDITERNLLTKQLNETNENLTLRVNQKTAEIKNIFERVSDAFIALDVNWCYTYVSKKASQLLNRSSSYLIGKNTWEEFPERADMPFRKIYEAAMASQQYRYHIDYDTPYGLWVESHIYPSPMGLSVYFRDISVNKEAEQQLIKEKELSEEVINSLPGIFYLYDEQGKFLHCNRNFESVSGYSKEEVKQMHPLQFFDEDEKELLSYKIENVFKNGSDEVQAHFLTKSKEKIPHYFTGRAITFNGEKCLIGMGIDLTELRKVEEQVKDNEQAVKLILASALDAIIYMNTNGVITYWNKQAEKIFGWTEAEVIGQSLSSKILPERYRAMHETGMINYLNTGEGKMLNKIVEVSALDRSGKEFPVELTIIPIKQKGNEFFCSFIRDITERKTSMEAMLKMNERFEIINRATSDVLWDWNLISDELYWNDNFYSLFEYVKGSFEPSILSWYNGIYPVDKERIVASVYKAIENKQDHWTGEYRFMKSNGGTVYIYDRGFLIYNNERKAMRMIGAMMDITDRKKAEESLRKAEEKYRDIFENTLEGIYQSIPSGQFIAANPAMAKIFGYDSPKELISSITDMGSQLYFNPVERLQLRQLLEKDGRANGFELQAYKKNKEIIWVRAHIRIKYDVNGYIKYFEGTIEDITDRKNAEEKLKTHVEELQKTNFELDKFVYSVSHDLRAPLSSILGLVNISELEPLNPALQQYLKMIRISVNKLDGFISDILDYSRNGRVGIRNERIDFHKIILDAQSALTLMNSADRFTIVEEINDSVPFYSDQIRIGVVFNNLLSNSIIYQDMRKDKPYFSVKVNTTAEQATITIADNGIGIEEKYIPHIFNMFYRASRTSSGSGLGLYISKETISKLGGTIEVESEPGLSTTFTIVIPNLYKPFLKNIDVKEQINLQ